MTRCSRGFTLVEMLIVVLLMGLMLGFAVPALRRMGNTQGLKGAKENIISQVQFARSRAISTGREQRLHFFPGTYGFDYHNHLDGTVPATQLPGWKFPNGVTYGWTTGMTAQVTMQPNGRANGSVMIPLVNAQGVRDTVVILSSGLAVSL